jgi:hypothetical protein
VLIVLELYVLPGDVLLNIFVLLHLEHLLVENLLQFLIGVVDAQLFKRILLEYFESENVQQPDKHQFLIRLLRINRLVNLLNDPTEERPVQMLC